MFFGYVIVAETQLWSSCLVCENKETWIITLTEKEKRQIQIDKFPDKLGNEQIKAVQSNFQGRNRWHGNTSICVNILNTGRNWTRGTNPRLLFAINVIFRVGQISNFTCNEPNATEQNPLFSLI